MLDILNLSSIIRVTTRGLLFMKKKSITNILILSSVLLSINSFADIPKEKIELNANYNPKGLSISVQGLGNEIIEKASSAKYIVFEKNGIEYAYSIKKLGSGDVKYIGNQSDINGLVFLEVIGYRDGYKFNNQLTIYRPSKYKNAIKLEKFDRDEEKPYHFDIGLDSNKNLIGISNENDVVYFNLKNSIKEPKSFKERSKRNF